MDLDSGVLVWFSVVSQFCLPRERNLQAPPGKPRDVRKERDTEERDGGDIWSEGWAHLSKFFPF